MMASSSGPSTSHRNWNEEWASKDIRLLTKIPTNRVGLCGCSICGFPRMVTGRVFRQHMLELHGVKPSPLKRLRQLTPEPLPEPFPVNDPPSPAAEPMDFEFDQAILLEAANELELELGEGAGGDQEGELEGQGTGGEPEGDVEADPAADILFSFAEMSALMEYANDAEGDLPPLEPVSPAASRPSTPTTPRTRSLGPFIAPEISADDPLHRWPFYIPLSMRQPEYSGARLNPHLVPSIDDTSSLPVLQRLLPVLAHVLSGVFNVARRPIELVLRSATAIIRYAEKVQYNRFKQWYLDNHPNAEALLLDDLDGLDPSLNPPAAPATLATALRQIQVETEMIVHPQCRNPDCSFLFLDITSRDSFSALPILCTDCKTPTRNAKGEISVLHFPRRSLKAELEVVFRVPGVEHAIERRGERKEQRDREDGDGQQPWGKVYRQQDDGSAWRNDRSEEGAPGSTRRGLSITVNIGVDWANLSSRRSAANDSIGPITLQIADLPAELRSSFSCAMIMGITPGPKAPKAKNLHKLLVPLVMELRDAALNGLWIRTPAYPQGRLVHVHLGCINCDRPAAVDITGGPSFSAKATPCLRCTITSSEITDVASLPRPNRDSLAHTTAILDQIVSVPLAVEADRQEHAREQDEAVRNGRARRRYPNYRQEAAIKAATTVTGNLSALYLLPGYDQFAMAVFDPMHSLLEGAMRTYMHKVLVLGSHGSSGDEGGEGSAGETDYASDTDARAAHAIAENVVDQLDQQQTVTATPEQLAILRKGISRLGATAARKPRQKKMTPGDMESLHHLIAHIQTPVSVPRLHAQFGTPTAGTPTANHWRVFATIYGPLSIPLLFRQRGKLDGQAKGNPHLSSSELKALMMLFEVIALALRSSISETQILRLESLITSFSTLAYALHPTLSASTNFHVITHLGEDIRKFGPTYGWWTFLIERINYVIKNVNQSGGNHFQAAVIGLRAAVKAREVISARMRALAITQDDSEVDKEVVDEILELFDQANHEAASDTLEQVSVRYAEIEKSMVSDIGAYSTSRMIIKPRGKRMERSLNDGLISMVQLCLAKWKIPARSLLDSDTADPSLPYIRSQATFWEGMVYGGRRLDAAEWDKTPQVSVDTLEAVELVANRNSLFESRRTAWIYGCEDARAGSGVLCAIFELALQLPDGRAGETMLFGVLRRFKAYEGEDTYGYRSHPALGVWLWEVDTLQDAAVIRLTDSTADTLRPLAIARLPRSVDTQGNAGEEDVWATIPLHHK